MVGNNYIGLLLKLHNLSSVVLNRQDQNDSKIRRSVNYRHVLHILLPSRKALQKEEFHACEKVPSAPNVSFVNYLGHLVCADLFLVAGPSHKFDSEMGATFYSSASEASKQGAP
jgi:hypothetical protein